LPKKKANSFKKDGNQGVIANGKQHAMPLLACV
jgi:hypothetical protein